MTLSSALTVYISAFQTGILRNLGVPLLASKVWRVLPNQIKKQDFALTERVFRAKVAYVQNAFAVSCSAPNTASGGAYSL